MTSCVELCSTVACSDALLQYEQQLILLMHALDPPTPTSGRSAFRPPSTQIPHMTCDYAVPASDATLLIP